MPFGNSSIGARRACSRWKPAGPELFYLANDGHLVAVPIRTTTALELGTPATLFTVSERASWGELQCRLTNSGSLHFVRESRLRATDHRRPQLASRDHAAMTSMGAGNRFQRNPGFVIGLVQRLPQSTFFAGAEVPAIERQIASGTGVSVDPASR